MIGRVGRVTGRIAKGTIGEVMLPIEGGTEAYYAYPADENEEIEAGARVLVVEYEPPRTVRVSRFAY